MKKVKNFVSFLTAAIMAVGVNASISAEALNQPEITDINGYLCYERDAQYWTMLDGDEYLVVNLDDYTMVDAGEESIELYSTNNDCPIGTPDGWYYCGYLDFSNGGSYTEGCYISTGDYDSKIYYTGSLPQTQQYIAKISTKQVLNNAYKMKIYLHNIYENKWLTPESVTITFNAFTPPHILFTGTTSQLYDGFAIRVLQSSTGETPFYYTITVAV